MSSSLWANSLCTINFGFAFALDAAIELLVAVREDRRCLPPRCTKLAIIKLNLVCVFVPNPLPDQRVEPQLGLLRIIQVEWHTPPLTLAHKDHASSWAVC